MTCGGRSWAGPERGSEILCVLTHGMGSTPPPPSQSVLTVWITGLQLLLSVLITGLHVVLFVWITGVYVVVFVWITSGAVCMDYM